MSVSTVLTLPILNLKLYFQFQVYILKMVSHFSCKVNNNWQNIGIVSSQDAEISEIIDYEIYNKTGSKRKNRQSDTLSAIFAVIL